MRSLYDSKANEDSQLVKRRASPQGRTITRSSADHDVSMKTEKSKKPHLNKVYAPRELLTRDEIATMVANRSPKRTKSRPKDPLKNQAVNSEADRL